MLNVSGHILTAEASSKYQTYAPQVEDIKNDECVVNIYLHLKQKLIV